MLEMWVKMSQSINRENLRQICLECGSYIICCPNCHDHPIKEVIEKYGEMRFYCGNCCQSEPHRNAKGCMN